MFSLEESRSASPTAAATTGNEKKGKKTKQITVYSKHRLTCCWVTVMDLEPDAGNHLTQVHSVCFPDWAIKKSALLDNRLLFLMVLSLIVCFLVVKPNWAQPERYQSQGFSALEACVWETEVRLLSLLKTAKIMPELLARLLIYLFTPVWSPPMVSWQLNWVC